jgi:ATP synthase protein I
MKNPHETKRRVMSARGVTDDLASRIASAKRGQLAQDASQEAAGVKDMTGLARGMRIGTEFVAAILVGTGIGFAIDRLAGTAPWAMLAFIMLGFAAGILNVIRVVTEMNAASPAPPGSDLGPDDEDDDERR